MSKASHFKLVKGISVSKSKHTVGLRGLQPAEPLPPLKKPSAREESPKHLFGFVVDELGSVFKGELIDDFHDGGRGKLRG